MAFKEWLTKGYLLITYRISINDFNVYVGSLTYLTHGIYHQSKALQWIPPTQNHDSTTENFEIYECLVTKITDTKAPVERCCNSKKKPFFQLERKKRQEENKEEEEEVEAATNFTFYISTHENPQQKIHLSVRFLKKKNLIWQTRIKTSSIKLYKGAIESFHQRIQLPDSFASCWGNSLTWRHVSLWLFLT